MGLLLKQPNFLPSFNVFTLKEGRKFGFDEKNILDVFVYQKGNILMYTFLKVFKKANDKKTILLRNHKIDYNKRQFYIWLCSLYNAVVVGRLNQRRICP